MKLYTDKVNGDMVSLTIQHALYNKGFNFGFFKSINIFIILVIFSALFKKQTKHGWDHDVQLSLQYYREDDKTHQRIVWKTTSGKNTTKILPLSMITEIREILINGM